MNYEVTILAGGCFWCMVKPFDQWPGVIKIRAGYTGGHVENPTYKQVCTKTTGHLEAVRIEFNPEIMPFKDVLEVYFNSIDPTDNDGQFVDRGENYKTAIFYLSEQQKEIAQEYMNELNASGRFEKDIAVMLLPAKEFYEAEEEHQNFYKKNNDHYKNYYKESGREQFIKQNKK